MTIKFSDETIREATLAFNEAFQNGRPIYAAAAVFEAAANEQVAAGKGWQVPSEDEIRRGIEEIVAGCARHKRSADSAQNTRDCVSRAPEPFQAGKRYRNHRGDIVGPLTSIQDNGWRKFKGENTYYDTNGVAVHLDPLENLLPGAIPNASAESADGITDEELGRAILSPGIDLLDPDGFAKLGGRARELLQPAPTADDPNWYNNLVSMTKSRNEALERTERAEAAIERARGVIEATLRKADAPETASLNAVNVAHILGLTITPARELTVTWEKDK